jgi:hypothetical protein
LGAGRTDAVNASSSRCPLASERFDPDLRLADENVGAAVTELLTGLIALAHQNEPVSA